MQVQLQNREDFAKAWDITQDELNDLLRKGMPHFSITDKTIVIQTDEAYQWIRARFHKGDPVAE